MHEDIEDFRKRLAEQRQRDADEKKRLLNIISGMAKSAIDERNRAVKELASERQRAAEERRQFLVIIENLTARLGEQNDGDKALTLK